MLTLSDLNRRLDAVRRKERTVVLISGMARTLLLLAASVLGYFLMDWLFELPIVGRWVAVLLFAGAVLHQCYKHLLLELRKIHDDDEIALRVEARNPDLHGRLISTVQLARARKGEGFVGSPELLDALQHDTLQMTGPLDFLRVISKDLMRKFVMAAIVVLVVNAVCLIRFPDYFAALAVRLVNSEYQFPTKTHIKELRVPAHVARGDPVPVTVVVDETSVLPDEPGTLFFRSLKDGTETPIELLPEAVGRPIFKGTLAKALDSMEVIAKVGDGRSRWEKIEVIPRPEVKEGSVQYHFPAYTGLKTPPPDDFGGLMALQGSTAEIVITATKPLASARLERFDGKQLELAPLDEKRKQWKLKEPFAIDRSTSFHVVLKDQVGLQNSRPPVEYPVNAKPDQPPVVKLRKPSRDMTVTPRARLVVLFDVRDDFGARVVWLVFRVQREGQSEQGAGELRRIERKIPKTVKDRTVLSGVRFGWDLEALRLNPGDQIVFWLEADDDCPTNDIAPVRRRPRGPGGGVEKTPASNEPYYPRSADVKLTVITRQEKAEELQAEIARLFQQVETMKDRQEDLKRKVRVMIEALQKELERIHQSR